MLAAAALCNDAALRPPEDGQGWAAVGDPTEAALLAAAAKLGLAPQELRQAWPRVAELPFDSARKRMTTVHRHAGGWMRVICKGAPETMLAAPPLADTGTAGAARARAEEFARDGYRVLAVAAADRPDAPVTGPDARAGDGEWEQGLARPRKLSARNRDHAAVGLRPLMGSEPGMRARRHAAGRAPGATGRPVAAWMLVPVGFHCSARVRLAKVGPLLV